MADLSSDPLNIFRSLTGLLRPIGQVLARPEVSDLLRKGSIAAGALYGSPIVPEQLRELAEEREERRRQKLAEENAELAQKAFSALGMPLPKDTAKALLMGGLQLRDIIRFSTPTYEETPMGIFEIPPALSLFGGVPAAAEPSVPTAQTPETQSGGAAAIGRKPRLVVPFEDPRQALTWPTGDVGSLAISLAQEAARASGRKVTPEDAWAMIPRARAIIASERVSAQPPPEWKAVPGLEGLFYQSTPSGPKFAAVPPETFQAIKEAAAPPPDWKAVPGVEGLFYQSTPSGPKFVTVPPETLQAVKEATAPPPEWKAVPGVEGLFYQSTPTGPKFVSIPPETLQAIKQAAVPPPEWKAVPGVEGLFYQSTPTGPKFVSVPPETLQAVKEATASPPEWKPVPGLEGLFYRSTPTGLEFSSAPPETVKATKQATEPPQLPKGPIGDMAIALARQEKGPDVTPEDIWAKYPEAQQIVTERTRRDPDDRPIGAFTDRVFVDEKGEPAKDLTMTVNEALRRGYKPMSATAEDAFTSRKLSLQMLQNLRNNIEELNRLKFYAHDSDNPATRALKQTWARLQLQVAPPGPLRLMQAQATQLIRILRDLGEKGNLAKTAWEPAKEGLLPSDTTYEGAITLLRMLDSEIRAYLPERLGRLSLAYPGPYLPDEWKEMVKYWEEQFSKSPEQRTGEGLPLFAVNPYSPSDPLRRRVAAPTPAPTPLPTLSSTAEEILRRHTR